MKIIKIKRFIGLVLTIILLLGVVGMNVDDSSRFSVYAESKISAELLEIMKKSDKSDLIPVWIFRDAICLDGIAEMVYAETGMKREIYENIGVFETYVNNAVIYELGLDDSKMKNPLIDEKIADVTRKHFNGFDVSSEDIRRNYSFKTIEDVDTMNVFNAVEFGEIFSDDVKSIVREVAFELADSYYVERLSIVNREVIFSNEKFAKNIPTSREVLHVGEYTGTYILRATPSEIKKYASLSDVTEISFFDESLKVEEARLDWALGTPTGAASVRNYGLRGDGIRIGVLEASSRINSNHPHLRGDKVTYVVNTGAIKPTPAATEDNHATLVTSIIVGNPVTVNGMNFEGVVPNAKVFQTNYIEGNVDSMLDGILVLLNKNVAVINCSFGVITGLFYNDIDKEFDRIQSNSNATIVVCAHNDGTYGGGFLRSPAKALNIITVGNARTVGGSVTAPTQLTQPYEINLTSSYREEEYLPNKPDVSAPGTNIGISNGAQTGIYGGTGTSFSTPIVTGIVAQYMQLNPGFMNNPLVIKNNMLLFARQDIISTANDNAVLSDNAFMREKSGAGMINAVGTGQMAWGFGGTAPSTSWSTSQTINLNANQKIRIVLVFGKSDLERDINSSDDLDDLDIRLYNSAGTQVAYSVSSRNNVEIIEYTVPANASGNYRLEVRAHKVVNTANPVPFNVVWRIM